jgi:hypothetical protein
VSETGYILRHAGAGIARSANEVERMSDGKVVEVSGEVIAVLDALAGAGRWEEYGKEAARLFESENGQAAE